MCMGGTLHLGRHVAQKLHPVSIVFLFRANDIPMESPQRRRQMQVG